MASQRSFPTNDEQCMIDRNNVARLVRRIGIKVILCPLQLAGQVIGLEQIADEASTGSIKVTAVASYNNNRS